MERVFAERDGRTRRDYLGYGAAVVGGSLLASCTDESGGNATPTATDSASPADESTGTEEGSYSVSMEPVGELTFGSVPETWLPYGGGYADMGVALGRAEGWSASAGRAGTTRTSTMNFPGSVSTASDWRRTTQAPPPCRRRSSTNSTATST